ncbi:hypothetical protein HDZ31DRAFT_66260 [Schizophyllum fasciatum]
MLSTTQVVAAVVVAYLGLVRALRWRKYKQVHRKYSHKVEKGLLTPAEAQEIVQLALGYDMHWLLNQALSFALFKTYGIPSISKLLVATKELSAEQNVAKRYADTELLIGSWTSCPIDGRYPSASKCARYDPRAMISMARVNFLHSKYQISNEDFRYTLCLFLFEPITWSTKYGWRSLSDLEKHAWFIFWVEIGKRMDIKDIPPTFDELKAWSLAYEAEHMVPSPTNAVVAHHTTEELVLRVPKVFGLKDFARRLTVCALDEHVRIAMLQDPQPFYMHAIMNGALWLVAFVQKNLMLPRLRPTSVITVDMPPVDPTTGKVERAHPPWFRSRPWYMPEPGNPVSALVLHLLKWAGFYRYPPGPQFKSEGYHVDELGPRKFENDGRTEVMQSAEKLLGCPIAKEWWSQDAPQ